MRAKGVLLPCCLATCLATAGLAQDSAPASRPASRPAVALTLEHGLKLRVVPIDLPGQIAVLVIVNGAGILSEPGGAPHLAHVSEHAVFHCAGDAKLVGSWFSQGRANAETLPELMYFDAYPSRAELEAALRIAFLRAIGAFTIADPIVQREKPVALAEVRQLEAARTASSDLLGKFAWSAFVQIGVHRAADAPFVRFTETITSEDVQGFCATRFRPDRATIVVVGDVDPVAVEDTLGGLFDEVTMVLEPAAAPRPAIRAGSFEGSWDVASHQFFMAWPAPPATDPAHPALTLLAQLLNLRIPMSAPIRKEALAGGLALADVGGLFVVQMPLRAKDGGPAVATEVRKLLDDLANDERGPRALKGLKSNVRMSAGLGPIRYPPHLPRKILAHANQELARARATLAWGQPPEEYCARVDAVTAADVRAAIRQHLAAEKAAIVTIAGRE
jgi:predicted Zn-dependent peptidase